MENEHSDIADCVNCDRYREEMRLAYCCFFKNVISYILTFALAKASEIKKIQQPHMFVSDDAYIPWGCILDRMHGDMSRHFLPSDAFLSECKNLASYLFRMPERFYQNRKQTNHANNNL